MNRLRIAITLFILLLIGVSAVGWMWTGAHQTASQAMASRTVLGLGMLGGVSGVWILWKRRV